MTREQVWEAVSSYLVREFGRLLQVRDVRRVRRVAGEGWIATVVLSASGRDLHIAEVDVDDEGTMDPALDARAVVNAIRRADRVSTMPPAGPFDGAAGPDRGPVDEVADLGGLADMIQSEMGADEMGGLDFGDGSDGLDALEATSDAVAARVAEALAEADPALLRAVRDRLPRLLNDQEKRGATLLAMAEVEAKLGEAGLARGYLEAAAREFADRFDMPSQERCAALALELLGKDAFVGSPVHALLEESRARLKPASDLFECRSFAGLPPDLRATLTPSVTSQTLGPGECLVNEGDPSKNVFVVKSGLLGVWLEKPSGGSWLVRCCFPGWLLGESSVLVENPRCTATLRAERVSEVWRIPAAAVRAAMDLFPAFAERIATTKQNHRIDSFFSMHETMSQLDVQVRDEMLSCVQRIETFDTDTLLSRAGEVPAVASLVARGGVALFQPGTAIPTSVIGPDGFYGVRDAIHQIAAPFDAIAIARTTVALFDADRLRALCLRSPAHVVAVLERLG